MPRQLHPFLVSLNTEMGNVGIQKGHALIFYAPNLAYVVWIEHEKFFLVRKSKLVPPFGPEDISLVEGGAMVQVTDVLHQEPFFLTPAQVVTEWTDEENYNWEQYADPYDEEPSIQ